MLRRIGAAHLLLIEVVVLVASADGQLSTPERRLLRRLGRALGREADLRHVDRIAERVRLGEAARPMDLELMGAPQPT